MPVLMLAVGHPGLVKLPTWVSAQKDDPKGVWSDNSQFYGIGSGSFPYTIDEEIVLVDIDLDARCTSIEVQ